MIQGLNQVIDNCSDKSSKALTALGEMLLLLLGIQLAHLSSAQPVTIANFGQVIGVTKSTVSNGQFQVYYGIPYAKPPLGDLRFAKPQKLEPVEDWKNKKYPANKMDKTCMQFISEGDFLKYFPSFSVQNQTEDCLYLNVYVPLVEGKLPPEPLPVMVFIHGGGFIKGSAQGFDAGGLAVIGKVVVVLINYRLGLFGFAQANHPDAPGNVGLYDQAMAFRWVKENIHQFKGDPNSITAIGQSAGSISIALHMMSKESRGLFHRAILESGTPMLIFVLGSESNPIWLEKIAIELGCPIVGRNESKAKYATFTDETLKCLRAVSTEKLASVEKKLFLKKQISMTLPSVDGTFLPQHPYNLLKNPEKAFDPSVKNIIIGHCAADAVFFITLALPKSFPRDTHQASNFSLEFLKDEARGKLNSLEVPPAKQESVLGALDMVYSEFDDTGTRTPGKFSDELIRRLNSYLHICPDIMFLDSFVKLPQNKAYFYLFQYRQEVSRRNIAPWETRAIHTDDLDFILGKGFTEKNYFTQPELKLSTKVISDWTNFAKTGKPSDLWTPCTESNRSHLIYDLNSTRTVQGYRENRCEEEYNSFIESIINQTKYVTVPLRND